MRSKNKIIYLEWEDAVRKGGSWHTKDEVVEWAKGSKEGLVKECGLVLFETKEFLAIASRWEDEETHARDEDEPLYGSVLRIPKTWIRKRIDLTPHLGVGK